MPDLKSLQDQPGTQREYETIFILRPDVTSEQIHDVNTRIRGVIEKEEGNLLRVENWGKRKLAYEIRKQLKGIYLYWHYLSAPATVAEVERHLRLLDPVIRFMTVKLDADVDPNARPTDLSEEAFAEAAEVGPDEEDAYLARKAEAEAAAAAEAAEAKPAEGAEAKPAEGAEAKPAEGAEAKPAEAAEAKPAEAKPAEGAEAKPETTDTAAPSGDDKE